MAAMTWLAFALAGVLLGAAQIHPHLAPLAWAGIALWALALHRPASVLTRTLATWLLASIATAVGSFWLMSASGLFFGTRAAGVGIWVGEGLPIALVFLPTYAAVAALSRRGGALGKAIAGAPRVWLPPAFAAGEALRNATERFSLDWLCSQSRFAPVLHCLGRIGWTSTLLVCLFIASSAGDYAASRTRARLLPGTLLFLALLVAPAVPADLGVLEGIGAVHIDEEDRPAPLAVPGGIDLLVWPEDSLWEQPKMHEETAAGLHVPPPLAAPGVSHLVGATTFLDRSRRQNSAIAMDPDGRVLAMRAKTWLMPGVETPLPWQEDRADFFAPGHAPALVTVGGRAIVTVVCVEALNRALVADGVGRGGRLLAVLASDRLHMHTEAAERASLAYTILRAAEWHIPAVRASRHGRAAIVSPDGSILGESSRGTTGVLAFVNGRVTDHVTAEPLP